MDDKKVNLTSAEIGTLWSSYQSYNMQFYILQFMLKYIEDQDIHSVVKYGYDISAKNLEKLQVVLEQEEFVEPVGFSEDDVHMNAPWLFTDMFCLTYVNFMAKVGLATYSAALTMCNRKDIREYFTTAVKETGELFNQSMDIALNKGISARHPYIEVPKETDFVDSKNYYNGLNPFSEKRPLNAIEMSHLYANVLSNAVGMKLCLAFAQTSPSKEVQEYMLRLKEVSKKHSKIFTDKLLKEDIEVPQLPDVGVSGSTTQTFSDKMIMFQMTIVISTGIGNYATAAAASQRTDLAVDYERLSLEVARLAKTGSDIMIKHNWLEQPPGTFNRDQLAKNKSTE